MMVQASKESCAEMESSFRKFNVILLLIQLFSHYQQLFMKNSKNKQSKAKPSQISSLKLHSPAHATLFHISQKNNLNIAPGSKRIQQRYNCRINKCYNRSCLITSRMYFNIYLFNQFHMRVKAQTKNVIKSSLLIESEASITDFQYNHNGNLLAVSDSDGFIYIYNRKGDRFEKSAQFKGDDAAIWKIAWAHPSYGQTIAVGSFKRKVAIFQNRGNHNWVQVAFHQIHEGSVNHVEWASAAFGLKLFSAGSDGTVAILQLKKNAWNQQSFAAHECSIHSLALRHLALNEDEQERANAYPLLATVAKDNVVKLWRHTSQISQDYLDKDARVYQQILSFKPHTQTIRSILWKVRWTEAEPIQYELFTSSEDGSVKLSLFKNEKLVETVLICRYQHPVFRISQSLTGNQLSISVADEQQHTYVFGQGQSCKEWTQIKQIQ